MAEKKPQIVIKKITVVAGGGHGGAWKVAFADFMTAMMAFFLVMWLLSSSSEAQKKAISDYFSTPSVIEYQFQNYGVELTLEKLFLDLVNDPLKTLQSFIEPMDKTPNIMGMGMKKVVQAYMSDQLGAVASNVKVDGDSVVFEIPDNVLFERGKPVPTAQFVDVMEKVKGVTQGLEESEVVISSLVYNQAVPTADPKLAKDVSEERLSMVQSKIEGSLENDTVNVRGRAFSKTDERGPKDKRTSSGFIRIEIKSKSVSPDGAKPKKFLDNAFSEPKQDKDVYDNFVHQLSNSKKRQPANKRGHEE